MSTRIPCPTARSAVPMAAVVLPLPGPVLTMIRPRRTSCIMKECLIVPVRRVLRANTRFLINQSPFDLGCALGYAGDANGFSIFGNQGVLRSVGIHERVSHFLKKCRGLGMKHNRLSLLMMIPVLCLAIRARADATRKQANVPLQANSGASHDQDSIRQILELERKAKDASVHRDAAFASECSQMITSPSPHWARSSPRLTRSSPAGVANCGTIRSISAIWWYAFTAILPW